MAANKTLSSPRIASLQKALEAGNMAALAAFWQEITEQGTPLIEAIEGDDRHYLVTFLWRAQEEMHNVVLWGGPAGLDEPQKHQLARLLDTDLWYKTYQLQADLRGVYTFSVNDSLAETDDDRKYLPDPLNAHRFVYPADEDIPGTEEAAFSILELPDAPVQNWIVPKTEGKKGQVDFYRLRSQLLDNERRLWVYTPAGYTTSSQPYGLLLLFDGWAYLNLIPTPIILDNLIREGKIPPLIAVLLDSPDQETRNHELACHQPFVDFVARELMPWVRERYHVTNQPAQTIVGGSSYGGLAAAFVGLRARGIFGNVLSQSGSFWWDKEPEEDIQQEWIIQQFIASPRLPLRFYLEVGLKENWKWIDMVGCNRHFRDILTLKGYEVHYAEFNGYHHSVSHRGSLADGLMSLLSNQS